MKCWGEHRLVQCKNPQYYWKFYLSKYAQKPGVRDRHEKLKPKRKGEKNKKKKTKFPNQKGTKTSKINSTNLLSQCKKIICIFVLKPSNHTSILCQTSTYRTKYSFNILCKWRIYLLGIIKLEKAIYLLEWTSQSKLIQILSSMLTYSWTRLHNICASKMVVQSLRFFT